MKLTLGDKIRQLRKRDGRKQEDLAEALGVTNQAVSRWESGGCYPDMELIPSIANYFNISIDELFGTDRESKENKLKKHYSKIKEVQDDPKSFYSACKAAYDEFPEEFSFGIWLCRCYIDLEIVPYNEHLDAIRSNRSV